MPRGSFLACVLRRKIAAVFEVVFKGFQNTRSAAVPMIGHVRGLALRDGIQGRCEKGSNQQLAALVRYERRDSASLWQFHEVRAVRSGDNTPRESLPRAFFLLTGEKRLRHLSTATLRRGY